MVIGSIGTTKWRNQLGTEGANKLYGRLGFGSEARDLWFGKASLIKDRNCVHQLIEKKRQDELASLE